MDETWRLRRGEGYEVCAADVTRLVCIFASQKQHSVIANQCAHWCGNLLPYLESG